MRITTGMVYERGLLALLRQQQALLEVQQQLSTGRRVVTPSDDPIAAARAVELSQAQALNDQYAVNRGYARDALSLAESTLARVGELIIEARTALVRAGNGTLSDADRRSIAVELEGRLQQLLTYANATNGAGEYLFSGYRGTVQPFVASPAGIVYQGDQGRREVQVEASRFMPVTDSGDAIFQRIRNGNGVFVVTADSGNTGGGVVDPGRLIDPSALTGHRYAIVFTVSGATTTYSVLDETTGTTLSSGNPYTSEAAIEFDGLQLTITGAPADADRFTVEPSGTQSLFTTLQEAISTLQTSTTTVAGAARVANGLNAALADLDLALDHVLAARASFGVRLAELDTLQAGGEGLAVQYQTSLSRLIDVDYAQAISDFLRGQQSLEAARASFSRVAGLSLFDYL